jgi:hypothetical protein
LNIATLPAIQQTADTRRYSSKSPPQTAVATLTKALPTACEDLRREGFKGKAAVKVNDRETTSARENEMFAVFAMTNA